jgi:hypothetical protein
MLVNPDFNTRTKQRIEDCEFARRPLPTSGNSSYPFAKTLAHERRACVKGGERCSLMQQSSADTSGRRFECLWGGRAATLSAEWSRDLLGTYISCTALQICYSHLRESKEIYHLSNSLSRLVSRGSFILA